MHAQDRFWEMDFRRHVTSGRVAEIFGATQVATDEFLRTLAGTGSPSRRSQPWTRPRGGYYQAYADA